jgi:hypothetical protein
MGKLILRKPQGYESEKHSQKMPAGLEDDVEQTGET